MWQESLGAIARMFVEDPFLGHEGKYFNDAGAQRGAQAGAETASAAVGRMLAARDDSPGGQAWNRRADVRVRVAGRSAEWVNDYYTTLENECEPIGYAINPNIAIVTGFMCDENAERRTRWVKRGSSFSPTRSGITMRSASTSRARPTSGTISKPARLLCRAWTAPNSCVGSPDQIRIRLREFEEAGVDQVVFISQAGNNKHEDICSSLNLFAEKVMPEFKEREQKRAHQKAERMAPIIEKAMKRKPAPKIPKSDGPTVVQAGMLV